MVDKVDTALIKLWGGTVGAVSWLDDRVYGVFEYDPDFLKKGLDVSPIHMSLKTARSGNALFVFPALGRGSFLDLPGMLADALPDKFGNSIIDAWLARKGRDAGSFSPVERLCYTGRRAMGALEFSPEFIGKLDKCVPVEVSEMVGLVQEIMHERETLDVSLSESERGNAEAIFDILRIGTSAGGARPKAVIAVDESGHILSGQAEVPRGYEYWILKFDGVTDMELGETRGYGRIEYAYYLMAREAGIHMTECRLLEENGRAHFMTRRFDRAGGKKLHMQSLCGIAHYDFNMAGAYGYEQAFAVMRTLHLSKADAAELFRRMAFNIVARNLDDHTKNIAFLMGPDGKWSLSPAYDVIYAHNPAGKWTSQHQMSVNGKRDHFTQMDLLAVANSISLPRPENIIDEVIDAVEKWPEYARKAGVQPEIIAEIRDHHRLDL